MYVSIVKDRKYIAARGKEERIKKRERKREARRPGKKTGKKQKGEEGRR
jgi:hypothetical protein